MTAEGHQRRASDVGATVATPTCRNTHSPRSVHITKRHSGGIKHHRSAWSSWSFTQTTPSRWVMQPMTESSSIICPRRSRSLIRRLTNTEIEVFPLAEETLWPAMPSGGQESSHSCEEPISFLLTFIHSECRKHLPSKFSDNLLFGRFPVRINLFLDSFLLSLPLALPQV